MMKTLLKHLLKPLLILVPWLAMGQGIKVSDFPATNNASDSDLLLLSVTGVTNKNITVANFKLNVIGQLGTNTFYVNTGTITNLITIVHSNSYFYGGTNYITQVIAGDVNTTNIYVSNIVAGTVYVSNVQSIAFSADNVYVGYTFTTNLYSTNLYTTVMNAGDTYTTNLFVTNINTITIRGGDAFITNLYTTNIYTTTLRAGDIYTTNIYVNNGFFTNAVYSFSESASNNPAPNEFVNAHWVRELLTVGQFLYGTSVAETDATNVTSTNIIRRLATVAPAQEAFIIDQPTNNQYVSSMITTNRYQSLQGDISFNIYMGMSTGGGDALQVHPEIYVSYDRTNWFGDYECQNQTLITGSTNLYTFIVPVPYYASTNTAGFYILGRLKAQNPAGTPTLSIWLGTNTASFVAIPAPSAGGGGTTSVTVTNVGVLVTNIAYTTNQWLDFSAPFNDYYMTNAMTNHIVLLPTNVVDGAVVTLSIQGASGVYTNWNVYTVFQGGVTATWLSLTNGSPSTTITSNKVQFYSFKVRKSSTGTNIIAAFKEQP